MTTVNGTATTGASLPGASARPLRHRRIGTSDRPTEDWPTRTGWSERGVQSAVEATRRAGPRVYVTQQLRDHAGGSLAARGGVRRAEPQ